MQEVTDIKYMKRCLQLAQYGRGHTAPNPMVGAVIVYNDTIIGEGYHHRYGEKHAEPNAIYSVKDSSLLEKSTLYVSLEPCSHHGKTPPCADLIIENRIPRVVIGMMDPNPKVAGKGIEKLKNAGIEVNVGVLEKECRDINKYFLSFQEKGRPYITLKWAQTQDGFIDYKRKSAHTPPLAISNGLTRLLVHKQRAENQAILIGTNTALLDNPSLTVRHWTGNNPVRIVIDHRGKIPENYHVLDKTVKTIIYTEQHKISEENLQYITISFDDNLLHNIIKSIYEHNINSVLIEGGAYTLNSFIRAGLWDEINVEVAPLRIGNGVQAPEINHMPVSLKETEGHKILTYKNQLFNNL